jgi:hypothetical protein
MATESSTSPKSVIKTMVWLAAFGDAGAGEAVCATPGKVTRTAKRTTEVANLLRIVGNMSYPS